MYFYMYICFDKYRNKKEDYNGCKREHYNHESVSR